MVKSFLFFAMGCILYASCKQAKAGKGRILFIPHNSKVIQVKLVDTLGSIMLAVPVSLDTSWTWMELSDCGLPCDQQKYRFQSHDSAEKFTISHSEYYPFSDGDTSNNTMRHLRQRADLVMDSTNPPIVFDTIEKIADRYYSIFEMERIDTLLFKRVLATTTIKGNTIRFQYDLSTKRGDSVGRNFMKNCLDLIRTIQIAKGI